MLGTRSEQLAQDATRLPAFENLALQGLRTQVAELLSLVGRSNEIFSTYTRHDISHIDAMLNHLDWIVPPKTSEAMTSVDWLLITLAIYFHDLGMLVTPLEFEQRGSNDAFDRFVNRIERDPQSHDYLARSRGLSSEARDKFFFQEFIREGHAGRIKEWITGRHSSTWGSSVKPIAEAISELVKPLPSRFRENLAVVCESHHLDNLSRLDLYPLCQRYGNNALEIANVQYAAVLLRTVDLIHVTKDRTPSIMYKTIKFTDPRGVEEWDKQKDVFSVYHEGRTFSAADDSTHFIAVAADFTEERPFFALSEYLSWADVEIKQSKRWIDQSQQEPDGAEFWFPWRGVRGDLRVEGNEPQELKFDFDRTRLLDLLVGHAIYNDATVAIRELLQNAIDAVRFRAHLDHALVQGKSSPTPPGRVAVRWNSETGVLIVEDQGIGMDLDTIKFHLMRVGSSFYDTPQFSAEHKTFTPISRFGIGVLTCFMISDDIEIVTFKQKCGYRVRMSSVQADYLLRELPPGDPTLKGIEPHGTRVTLTLRRGDALESSEIERILRYWIILPACPVEYFENGNGPIRIGFDGPVAAVAESYLGSKHSDSIEHVTKHRKFGSSEYEMAFAVRAGIFPEKLFASRRKALLSAVCIEGINVSRALPGFVSHGYSQFGSRGAPGALISVRGVRGLRTTVSRSNLELDEESTRLGLLCVEMLFEHVVDEVKRIASGNGHPLSRASTAGKWLCSDLVGMLESAELKTHAESLIWKLPHVLIEYLADRPGEPKFNRRLVSFEELGGMSELWSIESRLVDSLGILSRDLGRELGLFEFLDAMAPEFRELNYYPFLPDALLFGEHLTSKHSAAEVKFSRAFQQSATRLVPGKGFFKKIPTGHLELGDLTPGVLEALNALEEIAGADAGQLGGNLPIGLCAVTGDDEKVQIVQTRIATLVQSGSEAARVCCLIEAGLEAARGRGDAESYAAFYALSGAFRELTNVVISRYDVRNPRIVWNRLLVGANEALDACGVVGDFPEADFIAREDVFDAHHHWRDWHRAKHED